MTARAQLQCAAAGTLSIEDCRWLAERLTAVLAAIDEAAGRTTDLHRQLGAEGVYALTSELLPHAIGMGRELSSHLCRLAGLEDEDLERLKARILAKYRKAGA